MDLVLLLVVLLLLSPTLLARPLKHTTHITVAGVVYCDICSNNGFSRHSYFLPGVDVNIKCKFKAISPKTAEKVTFSVNRTTDKYGVYKLEIPSVDGVDCVDGLSIQSMCQASLLGSSPGSCNVPAAKTTTHEISAKSKQDSICLYSLNAMSYKPSETNATLCATASNEEVEMKMKMEGSFNSSKFFIPYFPPYGFFWPPFPQFPFPPLPPLPFPPLPQLPPLPSLPFPPLPPFPFFPLPPFPFPSYPPYPPSPSIFAPPPPPAFDLRDPRTWIPNLPPLSFSSPPPPPAFSLTDPRTWIPYIPPSPPNSPQTQKP